MILEKLTMMTGSSSPTASHSELPGSPSQIIGRRRNRLVNLIKQNDIIQLRRFIASCSPGDVIFPETPYLEDTLFIAASYGTPEALHILLGVYAAAPEIVKALNPNLRLLLDACCAGNIHVVRFILDCHDDPENSLPLGTIDFHQRDDWGDTPILAAARSLMNLDTSADEMENESHNRDEWIQNRIARSQQLINFLLDRGCSATDSVPPLPNNLSSWRSQVQKSVLGLAVSRGNVQLIERLMNAGADIHLKHQHLHHPREPLQSSSTSTYTHDVTPLHLASLFHNFDAVKLLLSQQSHKTNVRPEFASSSDSDGRLPLHWAASGCVDSDYGSLDRQRRITETLRLLLDNHPTGINHVDNLGSTPLHYAAMSHTRRGCSQYAEFSIRHLLEYKADPRIPDGLGRTVLHLLGYHSHQGDPINTMLLDSILSHGTNINHAEKDGKTALHIFARNLRQVSAAKFLIEHGADFRARNTLRETPFHAAARGFLNDHVRCDGKDKEVTTANKIKFQDDIMRALNSAAGEDAAMLMNQPNSGGKTPRDLLKETRNRWQVSAQPTSGPRGGRGRGRSIRP